MKLFEEHSSEYALRVGVNPSATSYYHYTNTHRHLATFIKGKSSFCKTLQTGAGKSVRTIIFTC